MTTMRDEYGHIHWNSGRIQKIRSDFSREDRCLALLKNNQRTSDEPVHTGIVSGACFKTSNDCLTVALLREAVKYEN